MMAATAVALAGWVARDARRRRVRAARRSLDHLLQWHMAKRNKRSGELSTELVLSCGEDGINLDILLRDVTNQDFMEFFVMDKESFAMLLRKFEIQYSRLVIRQRKKRARDGMYVSL